MKTKISIIFPVYNEGESLEELFYSVLNNIKSLENYDFDFLFINDGSDDNSVEIINKIIKNNENVRLISFDFNKGKTQALKTAFENSQGDYLITMDTDLQDDPIYIKDFINEIKNKKLDLVNGYRKNRYKNNFIKLFSSKISNLIVRMFFSYSITDMNCGYKILSKRLYKSIYLKSDYHRFIPVISIAMNFKVGEIIIDQKDRIHGESKYGKTGLSRFFKFFFDFITLIFILKFESNPMYFFGKIGFILSVIGFLLLFYLSILWFVGQPILGRPLFFLGILCLMIGTNFFGFGLLGELINKNNNKDDK